MSITLPPFALTWGSGSPQNIVEPDDALKTTGWTGTPAPEYQYFNWWQNYADTWVTYLRTRGVPDFHADNKQSSGYRAGDRVQWTDGKTYVALQTFSGAAHTPAEPMYFARWGHTDDEITGIILATAYSKTQVNGLTRPGIPEYGQFSTYYPKDIVYYGGAVYRCILESSGHAPPNSTYWIQVLGRAELAAMVSAGLAASVGTIESGVSTTVQGVRTIRLKVTGVTQYLSGPSGQTVIDLGSNGFTSGIMHVQVSTAGGPWGNIDASPGVGDYKNQLTVTADNIGGLAADFFVEITGLDA